MLTVIALQLSLSISQADKYLDAAAFMIASNTLCGTRWSNERIGYAIRNSYITKAGLENYMARYGAKVLPDVPGFCSGAVQVYRGALQR